MHVTIGSPGFPLYQVITESMGGAIKRYPLKVCMMYCLSYIQYYHLNYNLINLFVHIFQPESDWEIDVETLDSLVDSRTKAILINNPSNPCGSSFSPKHIMSVVAVAKKHNLPIIADEIYSGLVFDGEFCPFHLLRDTVPVITLGGTPFVMKQCNILKRKRKSSAVMYMCICYYMY